MPCIVRTFSTKRFTLNSKVEFTMDNAEYQKKLSEVRDDIDAIDSQLLPLLIERMKCSERVAEIKRAVNAPVLNAKREQEILDHVREKANEFGDEAVSLYLAIMSVSRARQHRMLADGGELREIESTAKREMPQTPAGVVCQGVEGAYSQQAALKFFGDIPISYEQTWQQVFEDVKTDKAQFGVLPVENSAAGSVNGVYDLILKYRFYIVGAVAVKIEHCLAISENSQPIISVASHPQALSQCSEYIKSNSLISMEYSNTAAAAQYVSEKHPGGVAAICSVEAAEKYGLTVLERGIQNEKNNTTRFIVISKEPILQENANKISLCFSLSHTSGALYNVLERFAACGLNMTKIESRPIPGSKFEYDFYLDFTGNIHDRETLALICGLHDELPRFSFLGNYSER